MERTERQTLVVDLPSAESLIVLAVDRGAERVYLAGRGSSLTGPSEPLVRWIPGAPLPLDAGGRKAFAFIYPTKTYSEGLGGGGADIAPEDRAMLRALRRSAPLLACVKVGAKTEASGGEGPRKLVEFKPEMLRQAKEIFKSCMTRPNRQDYMYLATKTFTFNLAVRLFFTIAAVKKGDLPLLRAILSTSWYQLQDTIFTVFGQTYMKFLGRMTGMLRVHNAYIGDFAFVYFQLCFFEFLNRLVLGPLGENPLVYTPKGLALIFANILQGMISGGPLIPAINQMRRVGAISHSTMMHFYQLSSLTMQFGLFAAFGYQKFYAILTGATLVLSWGSYAVFSSLFKDPEFVALDNPETIARLDKLAA